MLYIGIQRFCYRIYIHLTISSSDARIISTKLLKQCEILQETIIIIGGRYISVIYTVKVVKDENL